MRALCIQYAILEIDIDIESLSVQSDVTKGHYLFWASQPCEPQRKFISY